MAKSRKNQPDFRSDALAEALEKQDMAAVAYALRNDRIVVPLMKPGQRDKPTDAGEVWTYRERNTGRLALLLFSDAKNKPATLPPFVGLHDGIWLHTFLRTHGSAIETIFFDIAGPHPMQATPDEIMRVLDLDTGPDAVSVEDALGADSQQSDSESQQSGSADEPSETADGDSADTDDDAESQDGSSSGS